MQQKMLAAILPYILLMKVMQICVTISVGQASHPVKKFYVEMFSAAINLRLLKSLVILTCI